VWLDFLYLVALTFIVFEVFSLLPSSLTRGSFKKFHSHLIGPKKMWILSMNAVMCYFPQNVILQGNCHMRGNNIDITNGSKNWNAKFSFWIFKKQLYYNLVLYVVKNVMILFFLSMPQTFIDQFVFIWGCEQCFKTTFSLQKHIIILRTWNMCILHVKDYLMRKKTKCCSLTMS